MRDPERIPKVMDLIQQIWELQPDLRFFQLIESLIHDFHYITGSGFATDLWGYDEYLKRLTQSKRHIDLFHVEDEKFIKYLEWKLEKIKEGGNK